VKAHITVLKLFAYVTWLHLGEESSSFYEKVTPKLDIWREVPGFSDAMDYWIDTRIFKWWTLKVSHVIL